MAGVTPSLSCYLCFDSLQTSWRSPPPSPSVIVAQLLNASKHLATFFISCLASPRFDSPGSTLGVYAPAETSCLRLSSASSRRLHMCFLSPRIVCFLLLLHIVLRLWVFASIATIYPAFLPSGDGRDLKRRTMTVKFTFFYDHFVLLCHKKSHCSVIMLLKWPRIDSVTSNFDRNKDFSCENKDSLILKRRLYAPQSVSISYHSAADASSLPPLLTFSLSLFLHAII